MSSNYDQGFYDGANKITNILLVVALICIAFQAGRAWEVVKAEEAQSAAIAESGRIASIKMLPSMKE